MKKIASSKKYMLKIASYRNYRELQKIAAVGPGVIVGGPNEGLILPPSTRPEDNQMESVLRPSEERAFISSQDPVSFEETQSPHGTDEKRSSQEYRELDPEFWQSDWEKYHEGKDWTIKSGLTAEQYIEDKIEKAKEWYSIEPMTPEELVSYRENNRLDPTEDDTPIRLLLFETMFRINGAYDDRPYPPALEKLNRMIADADYKKIKSNFGRIWNEVVQSNRGNQTPPEKVGINLRAMSTILRSL